MTYLVGIIFIAAMIAVAAFFAGVETGLISVSHPKIQTMAKRGDRRASIIMKLLENPSVFISTALIGINLAHVILSVVSSWYFNRIFNDAATSATVTAVVVTPLLLFFGEILPKAIFRLRPHQMTLESAGLFFAANRAFYPITRMIVAITGFLVPSAIDEKSDPAVRREEILALVREGEKSGAIQDDEKEMIESVLGLGDKLLREVMTPRATMAFMSNDMSRTEMLKKAVEEGYTRYPVFDGNSDGIVGILHVADLLEDGVFDFSIVPKALFLSEFTRVDDALEQLRSEGTHMAIVVDEYGGTAGLVTIEDLLEELVGEIDDEHDEAHRRYQKIGDDLWVVDAVADIGELVEALGLSFDEEPFEAETVGGIILERAGRILKPGETIDIGSLRLKVLASDERRIIRVELGRRK